MNRRGFLQSCLLLAAAPAIVRADSLMRVVARDATIVHGPVEVLVPIYFDYAKAGADSCIVSAWVKVGKEWQYLSRQVHPGQRPFLMVPVPADSGITELYAPQAEVGDTIRVPLP